MLNKKILFLKYSKSLIDCGSIELQIIFKSIKINNLIKHLKLNKKDLINKKNLRKMISKRRKLLKYIKRKNINIYFDLILDLNLVDVVK